MQAVPIQSIDLKSPVSGKLVPGDLIYGINGFRTSSADDAMRAIFMTAPGQVITISYFDSRKDFVAKRLSVSVTGGVQSKVIPPAAATGFPQRAAVTWRGTHSMKVTITPRLQSLSLGGLFRQVQNTRTNQLGGAITIIAKIESGNITANVTGDGIIPISISGTVQGGRCSLRGSNSTVASATYEGLCGPTGFSGTMVGKGFQQGSFVGQFQAAQVSLVDIDQQERQIAAQKAERARQAAAAEVERKLQASRAAAEFAAKPAAAPAVSRALAAAVEQDSAAWSFHQYDRGSLKNVKVLEGTPKLRVRGEYTYNNGSSGWVDADIVGGQVQCLSYWNVGGCSPVRSVAKLVERKPKLLGPRRPGQVVELPRENQITDIESEVDNLSRYFPEYVTAYYKDDSYTVTYRCGMLEDDCALKKRAAERSVNDVKVFLSNKSNKTLALWYLCSFEGIEKYKPIIPGGGNYLWYGCKYRFLGPWLPKYDE